jgi:hypothetical protein
MNPTVQNRARQAEAEPDPDAVALLIRRVDALEQRFSELMLRMADVAASVPKAPKRTPTRKRSPEA